MVEALSNILNSGDVPNLYKLEDMEVINTACRLPCQQAGFQPTKTNIFNAYLTRVRATLHVILAFSPVGEGFRTRLRMFPSLVNCCTIDWFAEWPAEALYSVAQQQMTKEDLQLGESLEPILNAFKTVHQSVEVSAKEFEATMKRNVYVTPTSYLELIAGYKTVLGLKRNEVGFVRDRLKGGLEALASAEYAVANMETELKDMQPVLVKTQKEVGNLMTVIQGDKAKAAVTKSQCEEVEAAASTQAAEANAIKEDAQKDLDEALPALDVAVKCLKSLKLSHLQEVKALANPPAGVKLTMEAVCIMFNIKAVKKNDPNTPGKKIDDWWEAAKQGPLSDPKGLLEDLFHYDKDNIPESVITKIKSYIDREDFDPSVIKKASVACEAICMWTRAMYKYHFVARAVEPKRRALKSAEADLSLTMQKLNAAQASRRQDCFIGSQLRYCTRQAEEVAR
jgi:dynein heavy chain